MVYCHFIYMYYVSYLMICELILIFFWHVNWQISIDKRESSFGMTRQQFLIVSGYNGRNWHNRSDHQLWIDKSQFCWHVNWRHLTSLSIHRKLLKMLHTYLEAVEVYWCVPLSDQRNNLQDADERGVRVDHVHDS